MNVSYFGSRRRLSESARRCGLILIVNRKERLFAGKFKDGVDQLIPSGCGHNLNCLDSPVGRML